MMNHRNQDPYAVLGVSRADTHEHITRAYRKLLRHHHPDTRAHSSRPVDEFAHDEALRAVLAAYELITSATPDPAEQPAHPNYAVPHFEDPP
jgi:curved DNA-binding protein CbpA